MPSQTSGSFLPKDHFETLHYILEYQGPWIHTFTLLCTKTFWLVSGAMYLYLCTTGPSDSLDPGSKLQQEEQEREEGEEEEEEEDNLFIRFFPPPPPL